MLDPKTFPNDDANAVNQDRPILITAEQQQRLTEFLEAHPPSPRAKRREPAENPDRP